MELLKSVAVNIEAILAAHTLLAYLVLFFGSYFETLIGIGFFLYGEMFFLPGALLAGAGVLNIWLVTIALIAGGVLGDSSSFIIGRRYGPSFFKEHNRFFNHTNYQKGLDFFNQHGPKAIFLARLLGPLSWVMPFLAGTYKVSYPTFLAYNIPGVTVGIGQFLVIGYFFGSQYRTVLDLFKHNMFIIGGIAALAALGLYLYRRNR